MKIQQNVDECEAIQAGSKKTKENDQDMNDVRLYMYTSHMQQAIEKEMYILGFITKRN